MGRLSMPFNRQNWPIGFVYAALLAFVAWNGLPAQVISWDVLGYYLILPLTFIYNDPGLANSEPFLALVNGYEITDAFYQMIQTQPDQWVMKYPLGLAVLYAPFFAVGHLTAIVTGAPTDGLSAPYNLAMAIGSLLYSLIGIAFTFKILAKYFSFNTAASSLILTLLGSNWLITHGISMMMPHIPLFALTAGVVWQTPRWIDRPTAGNSIGLGALLGLAVLARPTEAWLAVVPFFWGMDGWSALKNRLQTLFARRVSATLLTAAVGIAIVLPQLLYWKWATGSFLYTEYGNAGEGLDLHSPHLSDFLFSFRKGWFVYTPLMAISMAGLPVLWRSHRKLFWPTAVFLAGAIYLAASWSTWWYAASFSQRPMVQVLPVMALPLAALMQWMHARTRTVFAIGCAILGLVFALNLFQSWQFAKGILPPDRITAEYYAASFLATSAPSNADDLLLINRSIASAPSHQPNSERYTPLQPLAVESPLDFVQKPGEQFSIAILPESEGNHHRMYVHFDRVTSSDHAFLVLDGWIKVRDTTALSRNTVVGSAFYRSASYAYHARALNEVILAPIDTGVWMPFRFTYLTPELRRKDDVVAMYFWRRDSGEIQLANIAITPFVERTSLQRTNRP